jgi:hypothetical protein
MLRTLHLCQFNFLDKDFRRVGNVVDGGTSLSGFNDKIETDGGGYWQLDCTNGKTLDRQQGLAWRAITEALDGGATAVNVYICERLFQPVGALTTVPHSDGAPFSDGSEYVSSGADYTATADAALRATSITIDGISEKPLIGGELFSIQHPNWGWRAYRIIGIDGDTITFRPPLREAIEAGTPLEFDSPRCQMRLAAATSNPTNIGKYTSCSISLVEDMRKPAS